MITAPDRARLEAHLRGMLGCPNLALDPPGRAGGPVQVRVGSDVLGTVDRVDDEGERSWAVTLIVLDEDLAG